MQLSLMVPYYELTLNIRAERILTMAFRFSDSSNAAHAAWCPRRAPHQAGKRGVAWPAGRPMARAMPASGGRHARPREPAAA